MDLKTIDRNLEPGDIIVFTKVFGRFDEWLLIINYNQYERDFERVNF